MSGAAGALLCCCVVPEACGSCPLRYRLYWSGSLELLARCCPVIYCPDPDKSAGEFTTSCGPCEYIIDAGGNPCRGDCPGDGCRLLVYDGSIGPIEILVQAGDIAPPCIYTGTATGSIEVRYCCPEDPQRPECGSGVWGSIDYTISASMIRGGFGVPDKDWRITIGITTAVNPYACDTYNDVAVATFHAANSAELCPHEADFQIVKEQSSGFAASMLDPCNIVHDSCPTLNLHAADAGNVQAIPA